MADGVTERGTGRCPLRAVEPGLEDLLSTLVHPDEHQPRVVTAGAALHRRDLEVVAGMCCSGGEGRGDARAPEEGRGGAARHSGGEGAVRWRRSIGRAGRPGPALALDLGSPGDALKRVRVSGACVGEDGAGAARRPRAGGDGTGVALEVEGGGGEPSLDPGGDRW